MRNRRTLMRVRRWAAAAAAVTLAVLLLHPILLGALGSALVVDEALVPADAAVVLSTGMEYFPRLSEAGRLYREKRVQRVVINGNRKTESLRDLERAGYTPCCPWYEGTVRILAIHGVPRDRVVTVEAQDAYDTVSEARAVGTVLGDMGITNVVVTTSKSHTRRALYIWKRLFGDRFTLQAAAARDDPYDPAGWWREGRQVRWVMAECGAWLYDWVKMGFRGGGGDS